MQQLYPNELAESWDNVGFLLECPSSTTVRNRSVALTIDLTTQVVDEVLTRGSAVDVIVAYRRSMSGYIYQ